MSVAERLRFDKTLDTAKRIETGSYYTPPELAEFMICLSLSTLLAKRFPILDFSDYMKLFMPQSSLSASKENQTFEPTLEKQQSEGIGKILKTLKVLDLCVGSGVFPLAYLQVMAHFFLQEGLETQESFKALANQLADGIYAVDIQAEPLTLYENELKTLYEAKPSHIKTFCLDALSDDALLKAPQLKTQMDKGFDLVLGNPPYLGEKHHKEIFQALRGTDFGAKYYEGKMDYFYFFIYRGFEALKADGQLCMITTNYFATADGGKLLRKYFKENTHWDGIVNFNDCALFKDALGQHNMIFVLSKPSDVGSSHLCYPKGKDVTLKALYQTLIVKNSTDQWDYEVIQPERLFDHQGMLNILPSQAYQSVLDKLQFDETRPRTTLGELFHVQQGIVSGYDRNFKEDKGVFVLSNSEVELHPELEFHLKPFYKNSQVRKYRVTKPTQYQILYVAEKIDLSLESSKSLIDHLQPHFERLSLRREVVKGIRPWYALQWPREPWRFTGPLIAAPQRAYVNVFAYEENDLYGSADLYYISDRESDRYTKDRTLFMTAYLNSPIIYYWLALKGKRKGSMLELYATPLKAIPVLNYNSDDSSHQAVVELTQSVLSALNEGVHYEVIIKERLPKIHQIIYKGLGLTETEIETVEAYYQSMGAIEVEPNYWYTK